MSSYATLTNRKIIVPSANGRFFAVEAHYFTECHRATLARIRFDEDFYLARNPDIGEAIAAGTIASAHDHYLSRGYYEHRLPYRIDVDEPWYLQSYEDIQAAVESGEFDSGQHHFDTQGFREGRLPFPHFALKMTPAPF